MVTYTLPTEHVLNVNKTEQNKTKQNTNKTKGKRLKFISPKKVPSRN